MELGPGPGPARAEALVPALGPKSLKPPGPRKHLTENSVVDSFLEGLAKSGFPQDQPSGASQAVFGEQFPGVLARAARLG